VHAETEDKSVDPKDSFYEELEPVFSQFHKYRTKILLGDSSSNLGSEDIFKLTIRRNSLIKLVMIMGLWW
jgi:hypothetical protein